MFPVWPMVCVCATKEGVGCFSLLPFLVSLLGVCSSRKRGENGGAEVAKKTLFP